MKKATLDSVAFFILNHDCSGQRMSFAMCTMKLKRPTITADLLSLKPIYYVCPHGSGIVKCDPKVAKCSVKER